MIGRVADPAVHVVAMDHIVLSCADVERTLAWYQEHLGLVGVRVEEWRRREVPFPSLRVEESTIIDLIPGPTESGRLDHVCLVVDTIGLQALRDSGRFEVLEGPVRRFGARGDGTSLYVRDPDGLTVELRHYGETTTA
jgi:catechol 2,3-dioxygenase-like lactoylglutathione lyase family enzyme